MQGFGPMLNRQEVLKDVLEASGIENPQKYIAPPQQPQPDFKEQAGLIRAQNDKMRAETDQAKAAMEMMSQMIEMMEMQSRSILNIAKAESEEEGRQLEGYISQLQAMREQFDAIGRPDGMAGEPSNQASVPPNSGAYYGAPSGGL